MTNLENIEELNKLKPEERKLALQILEQYSKEGSSGLFDDLIYYDYKEIPVDIITFILDDRYLGKAWHDEAGKSKLYPYWEKKLKKLFPDNISTSVNNAIFSGSRGIGKSEVAITIACYLLYRIMCLKNPLQYFGLKPTEKICFAFMNITKQLAEDIGISKFQNTVKMSPWFMERGFLTGMSIKMWNPPEPLEIIIGSQASDVIGKPIYFAFFDEISFVKNQDIDKQKSIAINMIDTAIGGMKTRFILNGKNPTLLVLASSKRSEKSFLEQHMKEKVEAEKENVLIIDEAIWDVKPKGTYSEKTFKVAVGNKFKISQIIPEEDTEEEWKLKGYSKIIYPPIDFKSDFILDIDRALCDFAGISSSEINKYINGEAWSCCLSNEYKNPFQKEILEIGNGFDDKAEYSDFFDMNLIRKDLRSKPLFVHMDMSVSGDMTGIGGVWIKGKKLGKNNEPSKDLFYTVAFAVSIKAPKGHQISFEKNRNFIRWLRRQGFNVRGVSTDSFQSYDTGQALANEKFNYQQISVDRVDSTSHVCVPYQYFKTTIYEQRLECFEDKTLTEEIIDLERNINTGKVDHPEGGRKDISDAICGSIYNASQHAEEFAFDYGESIDSTIKVSLTPTNESIKKQIQVDFEDELKSLLDPISKVKQQPTQTNTEKEKAKFTNQVDKKDNTNAWKPTDFGFGASKPYKPSLLKDGIIFWRN